MPAAAPHPCTYPGCGVLVANKARCAKHHHDKLRGSASERGYGRAWQKAREYFLKAHPLCVACERLKLLTAASVVDHIDPHRGDMTKFWNRKNWQSLCKHCHDVKTASEDGGFGR